MTNPTNPESNVPERVWLNKQSMKARPVLSGGQTINRSVDVAFIRSDIAAAQTNKKVRDVLERVKKVHMYDGADHTSSFIDTILTEYPDLLTNEEKTV